jgi:protein transport protein HofC
VSFEGQDIPPEVKPDAILPVAVDAPSGGGIRLQHMMFAVVVIAFVIWMAMVLGAWFIVFAIFWLVAGAIGLGVVLARRGSAQQESLLWALAIAAERGTPLAPAALAFSDQFSGSYRVRVRILAELLSQGMSLNDSLDEIPGLFSPDTELLVRVGAETGSLAQAFRVAANARTSRQTAWGGVLARFLYLSAVLVFTQVVMSFIAYFIAPKFEAIYKDFGMPLPEMTIFTIRVSHYFTDYGILVFLLLVLQVLVMTAVPVGMFGLFHLDLPFVDYFFRRRHSTLILRSLALTAEGHKTILQGLTTLAREYPSSWVRRRLKEVARDTEGGGDWIESLGDHALIRPSDEAVLASAERVGNLPWALAEVADSNERRLGYRMQLGLQLLFPIVIMALGALAFVVAVAYFSPIVRLIERLAG